MTKVIAFTKVNAPYGWMGNMSPYAIKYNNKIWRTAEALFQSLRFDDPSIIDMLWQQSSPMAVKMKTKPLTDKMLFERGSEQDIANMKMVLKLKCEQHPNLALRLANTGDALIVEDVSNRRQSIWGAKCVDGVWVGQNLLGKLWMELRREYK